MPDQDRHTGDGLGHGRDPEQRVRTHRFIPGEIGQTGRFAMNDLVLGDDHGDRARQLVRVHGGLDHGADPREFGRGTGDQQGQRNQHEAEAGRRGRGRIHVLARLA